MKVDSEIALHVPTASSHPIPRKSRRYLSQGYLFVAPAVLLILLIAIFPTFQVLYLSVSTEVIGTGESSFVGIDNYQQILSDPSFWNALKNTVYFTGFSTLGHLVLGLAIALAMNAKLNGKFLTVVRSLFLLPWAVTPVVVGLITSLWVQPLISPVGKTLRLMGLAVEFAPLSRVETALAGVTVIHIWHVTPFYMLMILAGLQSLDSNLVDAADVDGATFLQKVRFVIIPHIWNVLITLALFDIFITSAYFTLIWVTTGGGPVYSTDILATYIYRLGFAQMNFNTAAAAGIILIVLYLVVTAFFTRIMRRD